MILACYHGDMINWDEMSLDLNHDYTIQPISLKHTHTNSLSPEIRIKYFSCLKSNKSDPDSTMQTFPYFVACDIGFNLAVEKTGRPVMPDLLIGAGDRMGVGTTGGLLDPQEALNSDCLDDLKSNSLPP
jgi:hypothetical protein